MHVIYHSHCADGFASRVVASAHLGRAVMNFTPAKYGDAIPDVAGQDVLILDFSYKADKLIDLCGLAKTVTLVDHHKSAIDEIGPIADSIPNLKTVLSTEHSGCMLTWLYFNPGKDPATAPLLVQYVEDRDLWKFNLPDSKAINTAIFSYPYDESLWFKWYVEDREVLGMASEGRAIQRKQEKDIAELLSQVTSKWTIAGHDVPVANLPYTMASDSGNILAKNQRFAAIYYYTKTHLIVSLRSSETGMDVSDIAQQFGGGGHKHAAGFKMLLDDPEDKRSMKDRLAYAPKGPNKQESDE